MTISMGVAEVKTRFSKILDQVAKERKRLIVLRRGKPVAALVSLEDLRRIEALEAKGEHPIMQAFGGWSDRDDLDELVAEIHANRAKAVGENQTSR